MSSQPSSSLDHGWLLELQSLLLKTDSVHGFLDRLAGLTARALPGGSSCGVTVRQESGPATLAASDDWARELDELQYSLGEGPCVSTLDTGRPHYLSDTRSCGRWARFCRAVGERGVRSCLGLPLNSPAGLMGGYNFYSRHPDGFPEGNRGQLEVFAGTAAGAVTVALRLADQVQLSGDLRQALTSRAVIDQATGILMAQQRCDAAVAFDLLRRASQNRNIKLRDLAAEIVTAVSGRSPEPGAFQPRQA
jgi:GAF domain-containing protein